MRLLDRLFGKAEEINGAERCPTYLYRWKLWGDRAGRAVYLHHFVGDDWSRDLHDHPKRFISIGLWGAYVEETPCNLTACWDDECHNALRIYRAPWIRTFPATHIHRLRLIDNRPCWTLVVVLKPVRSWGFWHLGKFIPWRQYVSGEVADRMKSAEVIGQAAPDSYGWEFERPGPDHRGVLVPAMNPLAGLAARLGLVVFWPDWKGFQPGLLGRSDGFAHDQPWLDWNPRTRHELPPTVTDAVAGSPCPVTLTPWKLAALDVLAELEIKGVITSRRIRQLGCHPGRWTQYWLKPGENRGDWVRGDRCPKFDEQHPTAYALALQKGPRGQRGMTKAQTRAYAIHWLRDRNREAPRAWRGLDSARIHFACGCSIIRPGGRSYPRAQGYNPGHRSRICEGHQRALGTGAEL